MLAVATEAAKCEPLAIFVELIAAFHTYFQRATQTSIIPSWTH